MSDESRSVSLVLDTSAIAAFARGSIAVGELLAEEDAEDWRMVAGLCRLVGAYPPALAAWCALELGVDVMTRNPDLYQDLAGGNMTLPFED